VTVSVRAAHKCVIRSIFQFVLIFSLAENKDERNEIIAVAIV